MFKYKKYFFFIPIFILTSTSLFAENKYLYVLKAESSQILVKNPVEKEQPIVDPTYWTIKGINVAGKHLTFKGASTWTDSTCIDVNFGQKTYLGDSNTYKPINSELSSGSACSTSELIRDPRFVLPESGKYYFEISISSANANLFSFSEIDGTSPTLTIYYGFYPSYDWYKYNRIAELGRNWLAYSSGGLNSGETLQFWIDIDAGNVLINKLNYNDPSFYNNPILN